MAGKRGNGDMMGRLVARLKPKAKSLIVTVYGDSVLHRGGCAWIGSIARLTEPLGLNERAVRTSMYRLVQEGWLVAEQVGRRSYYTLTDIGRHRSEAVHTRIYNPHSEAWDGRWFIVATNLPGMTSETREALRRDLRWLGFGQLAPGVMVHPEPDKTAVRQAITDLGADDQALVLEAEAVAWLDPAALRTAIRESWDLDRVAAGYEEFLDAFGPVGRTVRAGAGLTPETCFGLRTLVMHAYRRVLLHDPKLPDALLDPGWPGLAARDLCRNLYRHVAGPAEDYLSEILETPGGKARPAHPSYFTRFGGLRAQGEAA